MEEDWQDDWVPPDDLSRRLDEVRWSTERLLTALRNPPRDEAYVRRPSLLPGWTRAHVLGHLARNADALVRTLEGTRRGERIPMYDGEDERAADIEAAARAGATELVDEVAASADRLERTWSAMTPLDWAVRGGHPDRPAAGPPADRRPLARGGDPPGGPGRRLRAGRLAGVLRRAAAAVAARPGAARSPAAARAHRGGGQRRLRAALDRLRRPGRRGREDRRGPRHPRAAAAAPAPAR